LFGLWGVVGGGGGGGGVWVGVGGGLGFVGLGGVFGEGKKGECQRPPTRPALIKKTFPYGGTLQSVLELMGSSETQSADPHRGLTQR